MGKPTFDSKRTFFVLIIVMIVIMGAMSTVIAQFGNWWAFGIWVVLSIAAVVIVITNTDFTQPRQTSLDNGSP